MRRSLTLGLMSIVLVGSAAACSSGGSKDSKSSESGTSKTGESSARCPVGTWEQSVAEETDFASNGDRTYTDVTGRIVVTFKADGDFSVRYDKVSAVVTSGGTSKDLAISGSFGGTYTVSGSTLKTTTTESDVKVRTDDVFNADATRALEDSVKNNDLETQTFACTGDKLTLTDDNGSETYSRA